MFRQIIQFVAYCTEHSFTAVALLFCILIIPITSATDDTLLSDDVAMYPRVRRLANDELLATVTAFAGGNHIDVYASSNDGHSFNKVSQINDSEFSSGLCCGSIFQLDRPIGSLPSGTLLWTGSVGQSTMDHMKLKVYSSNNNGRNWNYLSQVVMPNAGKLWEPELSIADDGALVMMFSDETLPGRYSQRLVKTRTYDGINWSDAMDLVASTIQADRPGMSVVSRMSNGSRLMTYELCGPARCTVFYKTSTNGWDWGNPTEVGTALRLSDGRWFAHAPYHTIMPDGTILVVGQILFNSDGSTAEGNGITLFKSASGNTTDPWTTIAAPVAVPDAYDHPCPNYSSVLLPVSDGKQVLEMAGRLVNTKCIISYGRRYVNEQTKKTGKGIVLKKH